MEKWMERREEQKKGALSADPALWWWRERVVVTAVGIRGGEGSCKKWSDLCEIDHMKTLLGSKRTPDAVLLHSGGEVEQKRAKRARTKWGAEPYIFWMKEERAEAEDLQALWEGYVDEFFVPLPFSDDDFCDVCRRTALWKSIRKHYLIAPPAKDAPYNLDFPDRTSHWSQGGQEKFVTGADWGEKRKSAGGEEEDFFFIEAGAVDGEDLSNTLALEKNLGWSGLLVEANPRFMDLLRDHQRHAWLMEGCLAPTRHPKQLNFSMSDFLSGLAEHVDTNRVNRNNQKTWGRKTPIVLVDCFPLYDVLMALRKRVVDYWSLDVEGAEATILSTIPFDKIALRLIGVENNDVGALKAVLTSANFAFISHVGSDDFWKATSLPTSIPPVQL